MGLFVYGQIKEFSYGILLELCANFEKKIFYH